MTLGTRTARRSAFSLVLALALVVPAFAPATALAAVDDDIPGVPIGTSPIADTLDATGTVGPVDADDVYAIDLVAGESFSATLTGDADTDFDALLFGPDATSVLGPLAPVAENPVATYPEVVTYTVGSTGTYYFDIQAFSGAGSYVAEWATGTGEPLPLSDDTIAGAVNVPASPVIGTLDDVTDVDDVYRIHLEAGQQLDVSLDWSDPNPDAQFQAFLFAPEATDIATDSPVADSSPVAKPSTFSYPVPTTGDYFLDVFAQAGSGGYTLDYTIVGGASGDGNGDISSAETLSVSPASGSLAPGTDDHDVYKIAIVEGQTLSVTLTGIGEPAPEFFADLYAPGTGSISETQPVATADPDSFVFQAPETGEYYLDVMTVDSAGDYQLSWSLSLLPVDVEMSVPANVRWEKSTTLAATLTASTGPLVSATVAVEAKPAGAVDFVKLADVQTDGSGHLAYVVTPAKRTEYRLVFAGTDLYEGFTTSPVTCIPWASVTMPTAAKTTYAVNEYFTTAGYLKPRHAAGSKDLRIYAQRYEKQGDGSYKWITRRTYYAKLSNYGSYSKYGTGVRLPSKGKWRLRAYVIGNTTHASTWSAARYVTVR